MEECEKVVDIHQELLTKEAHIELPITEMENDKKGNEKIDIKSLSFNDKEDPCMFIDSKFNEISLNKLKAELYDDLKSDLKDYLKHFVKHELIDNNVLVENMQSEISFLRQELRDKNKIINSLATKPLMLNNDDFSYNLKKLNPSPSNETSRENLNSTVNDVISNTVLSQTDTPPDISTPNVSTVQDISAVEENVSKQLQHVRYTKHKEYINLNSDKRVEEKLNKQLNFIRSSKHNEYRKLRQKNNPRIDTTFNKPPTKEDTNIVKWKEGTILITGDSMISGLNEKKLGNSKCLVKVRPFPGAKIIDMFDYLKPLLQKCPSAVLLHIGTNDAKDSSSSEIVDKMLILKTYITDHLPNCKVFLSSPTIRFDEAKASYTINKVNELLTMLDIKKVNNNNIDKSHLSKRGLHLNPHGVKKLALNFIKILRKLT